MSKSRISFLVILLYEGCKKGQKQREVYIQYQEGENEIVFQLNFCIGQNALEQDAKGKLTGFKIC